MEANDYRLERWLAILLSLLFFLPFVARADDIAFANASYHGDEMPYRDGEEFLALDPACVLVPVKIQVAREHDPIVDSEGEATGRRIELPGFEEYTFLLRGPKLRPGKVTAADPDFVELEMGVTRAEILLGRSTSTVYYRCGERECSFVLETDGVSQDLITVEVARHGTKILTEVSHVINFAGDLDGDGRLDLIMNASTHYNETRPALFLSTAARPGQLVGRAAELSMTGC